MSNNNSEMAMRDNSSKRQWSLIDFKSLEGMVKVMEFGAKKYAPHNWKKGQSQTKLTENLMRHLFAWLEGEDLDPESGENHIDHVLCNAMFLKYMILNKPDLDDRQKSQIKNA